MIFEQAGHPPKLAITRGTKVHSLEAVGRSCLMTLVIFTGSLLFLIGCGSKSSSQSNTSPLITTVAGTGQKGFNGDSKPATEANLWNPSGVAVIPNGGFLIADSLNNRVRRVGQNGLIVTVAGTGQAGFNGDNRLVTEAQLNEPMGVSVATNGDYYLIADSYNDRIRKLTQGMVTTVAGSGSEVFNGDNKPATQASLWEPDGVAATSDGGFLIADSLNHRIRKVTSNGTISTVAGTGQGGFNGDNKPATQASLWFPTGVAVTPDGGFLVADRRNNRIRKVAPDGTISTVAGTGQGGFNGDNKPANQATLSNPSGVAGTPDGGFLIADSLNNRVRGVGPDGTITTVAGTGNGGFNGDNKSATEANLHNPTGVVVTPDGGFLIADSSNNRVRKVAPAHK